MIFCLFFQMGLGFACLMLGKSKKKLKWWSHREFTMVESSVKKNKKQIQVIYR